MQLGRLTVVLLAVSAVALIVIIVIGATQARTPPSPTATPSPTFTPVPPTPTIDPTIVAATAAAQATASQLQAAATATVLACCELALRLVDEDGNPITDLIGYYYLQTVRPERRQERHYFKPGNTGGYVHTVEYGTQVVFELYPSGYKRVD